MDEKLREAVGLACYKGSRYVSPPFSPLSKMEGNDLEEMHKNDAKIV